MNDGQPTYDLSDVQPAPAIVTPPPEIPPYDDPDVLENATWTPEPRVAPLATAWDDRVRGGDAEPEPAASTALDPFDVPGYLHDGNTGKIRRHRQTGTEWPVQVLDAGGFVSFYVDPSEVDFSAGGGEGDVFKVKADTSDGEPDYLDSKTTTTPLAGGHEWITLSVIPVGAASRALLVEHADWSNGDVTLSEPLVGSVAVGNGVTIATEEPTVKGYIRYTEYKDHVDPRHHSEVAAVEDSTTYLVLPHTVLVDANDTVPGYLSDELTADGTWITATVTPGGANDNTLALAHVGPGTTTDVNDIRVSDYGGRVELNIGAPPSNDGDCYLEIWPETLGIDAKGHVTTDRRLLTGEDPEDPQQNLYLHWVGVPRGLSEWDMIRWDDTAGKYIRCQPEDVVQQAGSAGSGTGADMLAVAIAKVLPAGTGAGSEYLSTEDWRGRMIGWRHYYHGGTDCDAIAVSVSNDGVKFVGDEYGDAGTPGDFLIYASTYNTVTVALYVEEGTGKLLLTWDAVPGGAGQTRVWDVQAGPKVSCD